MPDRPDAPTSTPSDDPELLGRLRKLGWSPGAPVPTITRLAAYGWIRVDGRLLLARVAPGNLGAGLWVLPGGGLEFGEAPEAAAVREVEEETGLHAQITGTPSIHSDTGEWAFSAGPIRHHQVRFVYPMEIVGGTERTEVDGSSDTFGWFSQVEIDALIAEGRVGDLVVRALAIVPEHAA